MCPTEQLLRNAIDREAQSFRARVSPRSARGAHRADLTGEERVGASHVAEAIQYRRLDAGL
jgi:predicted ATPase with chaperone activity